MKFNSFLTPKIDLFIQYRRSSMRWNDSYEANLHAFDTFCVKRHPDADTLTNEIAAEWCAQRNTERLGSCRSRIYPVIDFIHYLNEWHNANLAEIKPPKRERRKYIPHAYTESELSRFFEECDKFCFAIGSPDGQRQNLIIPVLFRVLYSTGMRTFEVRMLGHGDVNLDSGVVGITIAKGYDQRYIILHDTMLPLLRQYERLISQVCPNRSYFFPGKLNGFITQRWLDELFRKLWDNANATYCRAYDFRHNYATQNINSWSSAGLSYTPKLVYLSKSMGHRDVENTKYYYSLVPAMAETLERQTGASFDELIPEVRDEESL